MNAVDAVNGDVAHTETGTWPRLGSQATSLVTYFRSFGVEKPSRLAALAVEVLGEDALREDPPRLLRGGPLVVAEERVIRWFENVLQQEAPSDSWARSWWLARARAAFLLADGARHVGEAFLTGDPSEEWVGRLREALAPPCPPSSPGSMPTQSLAPLRALTATFRFLVLAAVWRAPKRGSQELGA